MEPESTPSAQQLCDPNMVILSIYGTRSHVRRTPNMVILSIYGTKQHSYSQVVSPNMVILSIYETKSNTPPLSGGGPNMVILSMYGTKNHTSNSLMRCLPFVFGVLLAIESGRFIIKARIK